MRLVLLVLVLLAAGGCATTRYHERESLADWCMKYDATNSMVYLRNKVEAAREGAFGGFGGSAAGGCGCQ